MANTWNDIIGNYSYGTVVKNGLGKIAYMNILKKIEIHLANSITEKPEFKQFETLAMVKETNKEKKEQMRKYIGDKEVEEKVEMDEESVNPETGEIEINKVTVTQKVIKKNQELVVKKCANVTFEYKTGLMFLLLKYIHECVECYTENNYAFHDSDQVLEQILKFSQSHIANPIVPAIIRASEIFKVELTNPEDFDGIIDTLVGKSKLYFKNKNEISPTKQINVIIEAFVRFLKVLSIYAADLIYEKKQAVNLCLLFGMLRITNTHIAQYDCSFTEELFEFMKNYINQERKTSTVSETEDENGTSDKSETTAAKPKKTTKPRAAPKKEKSEKPKTNKSTKKTTSKTTKETVVKKEIGSEDLDIEEAESYQDEDITV